MNQVFHDMFLFVQQREDDKNNKLSANSAMQELEDLPIPYAKNMEGSNADKGKGSV